MYTINEIQQLRSKAVEDGLRMPLDFISMHPGDLILVCDGAGPANFPEHKREALTKAFKPYEAAIAIYDLDMLLYSAETASERLRYNLYKIWKNTLTWRTVFSRNTWVERFIVLPRLYKLLTK